MEKEEKAEFIEFDQVVNMISQSLTRANGQISSSATKAKDTLAYVATELSVSFPAEFKISKGKPVVRFSDLQVQAITSTKEPIEEKRIENKLATISINLRPVPL